jgi:hypothetical protein
MPRRVRWRTQNLQQCKKANLGGILITTTGAKMSEIEGIKQDVQPWSNHLPRKSRSKTIKSEMAAPTIWRFFDAEDVLLYVSRNPNANALMCNDWWQFVDHIGIQQFDDFVTMMGELRETIQLEQPKYNIHNKPR